MGIDAHRDAATRRFTRSLVLRLCGLEVKGKLLIFSFQEEEEAESRKSKAGGGRAWKAQTAI